MVGGGAAGFFGAITCAERYPHCRVTILEKTGRVLSKVRVSGGGRCNLTHDCLEPRRLVQFYPRGGKALLGPFHRFGPTETMDWFERRGVPLVTLPDGCVFPKSDRSQTVIDCLTGAARAAGVAVQTGVPIHSITAEPSSRFAIDSDDGERILCDRLLLATGSSPQGYEWARSLGHAVEPPVPSLFTFTVAGEGLKGLSGITVDKVTLSLPGTDLRQTGTLLITHGGLSGPAVLLLSSWGARTLHDRGYRSPLEIDWLGWGAAQTEESLRGHKSAHPRTNVVSHPLFGLPRRLWERLAAEAGVKGDLRWADISNQQIKRFTEKLSSDRQEISGKSEFKEEFVTCGGVRLDEIDFKTLRSKVHPALFFAGEILDVDGVTGGFNLQNAWTTGFLAGEGMGESRAG